MSQSARSYQPPSGGLDGATWNGDLNRPLYGASFSDAVRRFFRRYSRAWGRSSRSEFWWAYLFQNLVTLVPAAVVAAGLIPAADWVTRHPVLTTQLNFNTMEEVQVLVTPDVLKAPTGWLITLGALLFFLTWAILIWPTVTLLTRRLHDTDRSAGFFALIAIPWVGELILLLLLAGRSQPTGRRFDAHGPM